MTDNKVTIDAAWFAELYARWIAKPTFSERMVANGAQAIRENEELRKERDNLRKYIEDNCASCSAVKERDELKEKLDGDATANGLSPATQKLLETERRLAAAERCIEDIAKIVFPNEKYIESNYRPLGDIIRAYREKKESAQ